MISYRNIIIPLAIKAGNEILKYYGKNPLTKYKLDNSPVTEADLVANQIIIDGLKSTNLPVLSEESESISYKKRKNWDKFWIIDPLDGTKQFVRNEDEFTVNIALIENNTTVEGVVFAPALNILYYGNSIDGAEKIIINIDMQPIKMTCLKSDILRIVASKSHLNEATKAYLNEINNRVEGARFVNVGSSLKFCLVAEGKADLYPRFGPINEWDIAAGHAVLKAAGGYMIDINTGKELTYNSESLCTPDFVAYGDADLIIKTGVLNIIKK
jgi:3'(2'), 5'-bisphosphate nucleotidase